MRRAPGRAASACCWLTRTTEPQQRPALFAEAARQGLEPRLAVGTYLLTAVEEGPHAARWDYYRAWVLG